MARADVLKVLYAKTMSPLEFNFESLMLPSMHNYLTPWDVQGLNDVATSVRYNANRKKKNEEIDRIMTYRGFRRFHSGTNRVVYRHLEDPRFVAKIALDRTGLTDNPNEFKNQQFLKPFITKVFEVSPCGTIAFVEKVEPVTSKEEFLSIADNVFDLLVYGLLGLYALDDVGTDFFMNWGVRVGFGPVLLDFPYVFELDGNRLHCNLPEIDPISGLRTGRVCDGEIDYDAGFNYLYCQKCGKKYYARDLAKAEQSNFIILKGGCKRMSFKIAIRKDGKIYSNQEETSTIVEKPKSNNNRSNGYHGGFVATTSKMIANGKYNNQDFVSNDSISTENSNKADNNKDLKKHRPKFNKNRFKFNPKSDSNVTDDSSDSDKTESSNEVIEEDKTENTQNRWGTITSDIPDFNFDNAEDFEDITIEDFRANEAPSEILDDINDVIDDIREDFTDHVIRLDENAESTSTETSKYIKSNCTVITFIMASTGDIYFKVIMKDDSSMYLFKDNLFRMFPDIAYFNEEEESDDNDDEEEEEEDEDTEEIIEAGISPNLESVFPKLTEDFKRMCYRQLPEFDSDPINCFCFKRSNEEDVYVAAQYSDTIFSSTINCGKFDTLYDHICKERGIEYINPIKEKLKNDITSDEVADLFDSITAPTNPNPDIETKEETVETKEETTVTEDIKTEEPAALEGEKTETIKTKAPQGKDVRSWKHLSKKQRKKLGKSNLNRF